MPPVIVSLFDYTAEAVRPWAEAGYECHVFDLQHPLAATMENVGKGLIYRWHWDANWGVIGIRDLFKGLKVAGIFAFPPCTDLAGLGAKHWAAKREADPDFQRKAVRHARLAETLAGALGCWYVIENPVGALSTLWRKPDHTFNPCDYGGYIPEAEAEHPLWPDVIPARDAYTKRTCLWTGPGFVMPEPDPVDPTFIEFTRKDGTIVRGSPQWGKLGGKSLRTKNIRSATPRGFARAAFNANGADPEQERIAA